jgi:hypothetical protein
VLGGAAATCMRLMCVVGVGDNGCPRRFALQLTQCSLATIALVATCILSRPLPLLNMWTM